MPVAYTATFQPPLPTEIQKVGFDLACDASVSVDVTIHAITAGQYETRGVWTIFEVDKDNNILSRPYYRSVYTTGTSTPAKTFTDKINLKAGNYVALAMMINGTEQSIAEGSAGWVCIGEKLTVPEPVPEKGINLISASIVGVLAYLAGRGITLAIRK